MLTILCAQGGPQNEAVAGPECGQGLGGVRVWAGPGAASREPDSAALPASVVLSDVGLWPASNRLKTAGSFSLWCSRQVSLPLSPRVELSFL